MSPNGRMHILYMVQYFNSPDDPGGSRAYEFARRWADRGHTVTLLAGNLNHKTLSTITAPTVAPAGVTVVRVRTYNRIRGSYARRIVNFLSYAAAATLKALTIRNVDIVYASSTPLTTGGAGFIVALFKRRDLLRGPRSLAGIGCRRRSTEAGTARSPHRTSRTLALCAGRYARGTDRGHGGIIERGGASGKVMLVPNGTDDWMVDSRSTVEEFPVNTNDHFVCTYMGALGRWNRLETLLDAQLVEGSRIRFLIVGDGDHRDEPQKRAETLGLTNVVFHGAFPRSRCSSTSLRRTCASCSPGRIRFSGRCCRTRFSTTWRAGGRSWRLRRANWRPSSRPRTVAGSDSRGGRGARSDVPGALDDRPADAATQRHERARVRRRHYRRSRLADHALDAMVTLGRTAQLEIDEDERGPSIPDAW